MENGLHLMRDGTKQSMGEYNNGAKIWKMVFLGRRFFKQVDFLDSRIAEVKMVKKMF